MDGSKSEGGYWEKRRLALLQQMERDEAKLNDKLARTYQTEIAKLDREIASYYQRYGEKNVIEYRKLLTTLSDDDRTLLIERMEEFGKKYPQYAHLLPVRESIYKLNEMEGIQLSMRMQQLEIGAIEQDALQKHLEKQALRSANLAAEQMGFGKSFYTYDASVIKATVGKAWANEQSFSERIWGNRQKLASYLNDDFAKAVARGASYEQVMRELGTRFENVSKRDMRRLVFTEGTYVFNEAHAQTHEQMFDHYTLSTASDSGVCKQCRETEEQTRKEPVLFKDRSPGVNFPPLHPGCRCSYEVAVDDWDAWIEKQVAKAGGDSLQKRSRSASVDAFDMDGISELVKEAHGFDLDASMRDLNAESVELALFGFEHGLSEGAGASSYVTGMATEIIGMMSFHNPKGTLGFNPRIFRMKTQDLSDALAKGAEKGNYHAGATVESVGVHEAAHVKTIAAFFRSRQLDYPVSDEMWEAVLAEEYNAFANSIVLAGWKKYLDTPEGAKHLSLFDSEEEAFDSAIMQISKIAFGNRKDAIAESDATVFTSGREHNALATAIHDALKEAL